MKTKKPTFTTALLTASLLARGALAQDAGNGPATGTATPPPAPPERVHEEMRERDHDHDRDHGHEHMRERMRGHMPPHMHAASVSLDVDSTRPSAVIEQRVAVREGGGAFLIVPFRTSEATWEQVCVTPCKVVVDQASTYRVRAQNGISASREFTLPQNSEDMRLHVDAGNLGVHRLGQGLSAIGGAALIVGIVLIAAASDFDHEKDARTAGFITGGAGLLALAIGIPLAIATQSHAEVDGRRLASTTPEVALGSGVQLTPRGLVF